jgi:hypothetical protein
MPFRYVAANDGGPIMPAGMIDLIKADADKGFDDIELADEVDGMESVSLTYADSCYKST